MGAVACGVVVIEDLRTSHKLHEEEARRVPVITSKHARKKGKGARMAGEGGEKVHRGRWSQRIERAAHEGNVP